MSLVEDENIKIPQPKPELKYDKPHKDARIGRVVGIVSGKGGVGKSAVTSLLAVEMSRRGKRVAVLDADITGPSIPMCFGVTGNAEEHETDPVIWRGPVIAGVVKQFWQEVIWQDVDYMFIDMPPGTGDVPLTVFQSIPLCGIVVVTSPQELVSMIVEKAVQMAGMMKMNVLGIVENMSYFTCPNCGGRHYIFGESHIESIASSHGIGNVVRLPIDMKLSELIDTGRVEEYTKNLLSPITDALLRI